MKPEKGIMKTEINWIPITDRKKPKHDDICLVVVRGDKYRIEPRIEIASARWSCLANKFLHKPEWSESVSHWASMPELEE